MVNRRIELIFSRKYSTFKLYMTLLFTTLLFTIFSSTQDIYDPILLSTMVTSILVLVYKIVKINIIKDLDRKKETIYLILTSLILVLTIYLNFYFG